MIRKIAGLETNNRYLLASTLILLLGAGGCNLLKNLLNKGDTADAQASGAPSAGAAPSAIVAEIPSIAPLVPSVALPSTHVHVATSTAAKTTTHTGTSTGVTTAPAAASASAAPVASAAAPAAPVISPECQAACQKSFQDCMTQKTGVAPLELVRQCRAALAPCVPSCSK